MVSSCSSYYEVDSKLWQSPLSDYWNGYWPVAALRTSIELVRHIWNGLQYYNVLLSTKIMLHSINRKYKLQVLPSMLSDFIGYTYVDKSTCIDIVSSAGYNNNYMFIWIFLTISRSKLASISFFIVLGQVLQLFHFSIAWMLH